MAQFNRVRTLASLVFISATSVVAQDHTSPKFKAEVPASIQTPDTVETRIGKLEFSDGLPSPETVQKVYDNIDFARGVEAFLSGMPAASVYALCKGLEDVGAAKNKGIGITEDLMDARSLFLTANTTTVYVFFCVDLADGRVIEQVNPGVLGNDRDA